MLKNRHRDTAEGKTTMKKRNGQGRRKRRIRKKRRKSEKRRRGSAALDRTKTEGKTKEERVRIK